MGFFYGKPGGFSAVPEGTEGYERERARNDAPPKLSIMSGQPPADERLALKQTIQLRVYPGNNFTQMLFILREFILINVDNK